MSENRSRWPMFRQVKHRARRTQDMIERLDVDQISLVRMRRGEAYADLLRLCLNCTRADVCLQWFEGDEKIAGLPEFCPNLSVFMKCRRSTRVNKGVEQEA